MNARQVIIRPVISEKSYALMEAGVYTFCCHIPAGSSGSTVMITAVGAGGQVSTTRVGVL